MVQRIAKLLIIPLFACLLLAPALSANAQTKATKSTKAKVTRKAPPVTTAGKSAFCVDQYKSCNDGCAGIKAGHTKDLKACKSMCDGLLSACK
jgi:hypothetical protein